MAVTNKDFLDFVIEFDFFQDEETTLWNIDEFLELKTKGEISLYALSFSREHSLKEGTLKYYRKVFVPKTKEKEFDKCVQETFSLIKKEEESQNSFEKELKAGHVFCFKYFQKGNQEHWVMISSKNKIETTLAGELRVFIENVFKSKKKIMDLEASKNLAFVDDVTSLFNQRKLYKDLNYLVNKYQKAQEPFSVLFIDIDYFKKVNDGHGHLIGSKLLSELADVIRSSSRDSDHIYRYGGDEFVMLLPKCSKESAAMVAERLLGKVKSHNFQVITQKEMSNLSLSVSIGVASYPVDATGVEDVLRIADETMYEAKKAGRGKVYFYSDSKKKK